MKRVMNAAFSWRSGGGFYISGNKAQWGRRRSGGDTGTNMLRFIAVTTSLLALAGVASAASVVNRDAETHTLIVTEGGAQSEVAVPAGLMLLAQPVQDFGAIRKVGRIELDPVGDLAFQS